MTDLVVDAHHHLWDPARANYPWMTTEVASIARAFVPADLAPRLAEAGVDATIAVQARSGVDETRELLATAAATPFIAGVVGWVDLTDPGIEDDIAGLRDGPGGERLVGIRHQVHDEPDPAWLGRPDVRRGVAAVGRAGLAYDLLVRPRELRAALAVARALPDVRFVIDHLAKPQIREGMLEPWATRLASFGDLPNVTCKLSGLVTEADWASWHRDQFVPYVHVALGVFGPERLLFGSDWPVCLLAATYRQVIETARWLAAGLAPAEQAAIFGGTARAVYRLGDRASVRPGGADPTGSPRASGDPRRGRGHAPRSPAP
ncbi:MAG: amidohydrolase family protein [Chloroflexota bacterium]